MISNAGADVLLVTATKVEMMAVLRVFGVAGEQATPQSIDGRVYFDLGTVNGARIRMTRCEMGAGGLGASLQAVGKGIAALSPAAVIMVGIAFGVDQEKQSIGDVLVTEQLRPYDLQRAGTREDGGVQIILRDDKPHSSPWLLNLLKSSEVTWEGATVRFGTIMTGARLVDNVDLRGQLYAFEQEAIGGEMEGAGLYVACHDEKVDWILVKAICDFADGQKARDKAERQALAANNAAAFVHHALRFVKVDWRSRRRATRSFEPTAAQEERRRVYQTIWERLQDAEAQIRLMKLTTEEFCLLARDVNLLVMKNEIFLDSEDRATIDKYLAASFDVARYIEMYGSSEDKVNFASTASLPDHVIEGARVLQHWDSSRNTLLKKVRSVLG